MMKQFPKSLLYRSKCPHMFVHTHTHQKKSSYDLSISDVGHKYPGATNTKD